MAELTVAAGYTKALIELAVSKGACARQLCDISKIDPDVLLDQDNRINLANHIALMRAARELCKEPALALHFGASSPSNEISIVGLICYAASDMREAFAQTNRFGQLIIEVEREEDSDRFKIVRDNGEVWIVDTRKNPDNFPELTESTFARFISEHEKGFGDIPFVKAVHVTHEKPAYSDEYDLIYKKPIVFSSDKNALLIAESWLDIQIPKSNGYVFGILSEHAAALLKSLENSKSIQGKVESLIIPILHTGEISMEHIAEELGLSRQALYRKLKAEGVTFEKLLDELRHQMALHFLNGKKVSVTETAYLVGFSDPSAFSRAFKRWTGASPSKVTTGDHPE